MFIRKKTFILLVSYLSAALLGLGAYAYALSWGGQSYRRAAAYGYEHAFSEVVNASEKLSDALHRGVYATGAATSNEVCADVYGSCLAAGMTMSALPFTTYELERTAGFIGTAGDYAQSLLRNGTDGFDEKTRESFLALYKTSDGLTRALKKLQDEIINGDLIFDEPENRFSSGEGKLLSAALIKLEADADELPELDYDGVYTKTRGSKKSDDAVVSEAEAKKAAAEFLGVNENELKLLSRAENGATCFTSGDRSILVDAGGCISSLSTGRAVAGSMSDEELKKAAEDFLAEKGFCDLSLCSSERVGSVLALCYDGACGGVRREADKLRISVAADDGSIYSFSAPKGGTEPAAQTPAVSKTEAAKALPGTVKAQYAGLVYAETPGGADRLCHNFICTRGDDSLHILVDAMTGRQFRISFS